MPNTYLSKKREKLTKANLQFGKEVEKGSEHKELITRLTVDFPC